MFFYFVRQSFEESVFLQLTLPDHNQIPAELFQLFFRFSVPVDIPLEFLLPEFDVCGRCGRLAASRMPMPKKMTNSVSESSFLLMTKRMRISGLWM